MGSSGRDLCGGSSSVIRGRMGTVGSLAASSVRGGGVAQGSYSRHVAVQAAHRRCMMNFTERLGRGFRKKG